VPDVRHPGALLLAVVGACQAPASDSSAFATMPEITTVPGGSTTEPPAAASSSSGDISTTTSGAAGSGDTSTGGTTTLVPDLGEVPDFTDGNPIGCQGKIDFLFVISSSGNMESRQLQLINAFPKFIDTIESKFADFDYHIMVIAGDDEWGASHCTADCPVFDCKIGDLCCQKSAEPEWVGKPCCGVEDYPCDKLDLVTPCDTTFGAGEVFPAGGSASNMPCPIDGGRRYMVKGQTDLNDTFACAAKVGASGGGLMGQALTAAMQKDINDGGCNNGFLRDDALLMVTLISTGFDIGGGIGNISSEGYAEDWAKAVLDAKHGDPESVVMLNILRDDYKCDPQDELCKLVKMFPYWTQEWKDTADFGPAFDEATSLVETACAEFVPPG
jgi:hypothetical protein